MPEGDTIHHAAKRVRAALAGADITSIETPHPRHSLDRWPERLRGRAVRLGIRTERAFLSRLRADHPTHGIGNLWKSESCFLAGVDPWRRAGEVADEEALAIVREARPLMLESAERGGRRGARWVYERAGLPCRRCNGPISSRGQGDDNRTTFWCPACQG